MAQGYRPDEVFNAREVYADIIDLPGWEPGPKHPRMPLAKRAAQFAPFAALTGYKEMLEEALRISSGVVAIQVSYPSSPSVTFVRLTQAPSIFPLSSR